ncbi:MAG: hypothetical protein WC551_01540 [Patescibacteria group bacterium]
MEMLTWHYLIFYISIVFGLVIGLGSAFSGHGGDTDGDADADADGDVDHDVDGGADHDADAEHDAAHSIEIVGQTRARRTSAGRIILRFLGVGKAPIAVLLMTFCLFFGLAGILLNQLFTKVMSGENFGLVSVGLALIIAFVLARLVAGTIHRFLPSFETYSVTNKDLVGRMATLILPADAKNGTAQVHDQQGSLHQIACRTDGPAIAKGASVLIVQYNSENDTYLVERNPLTEKGDV